MLEYDAFASWACPWHRGLSTAISARTPRPIVLNVFLAIEFLQCFFSCWLAAALGCGQVWDLHHRPNFDRPFACARDASGDVDGLVEVLGFHHKKAAKLFARFGKWTVGHQPFAVAHSNGSRCRHRLQWRRAQKLAIRLERVSKLGRFSVTLLALGVRPSLFVGVNQQHVLHSFPSMSKSNG